MKTNRSLTLVLYPNTFGLAYVLCKNPTKIIDFGIRTIGRHDTKKWKQKISELVHLEKPNMLVVMKRDIGKNEVSKRIRKLLGVIEYQASKEEIAVAKYTRAQINEVFDFRGKHNIAIELAKRYPQLKNRIPRKRDLFQAEHYQMGLFDAFSLMLTHFYRIS